MNQEPLISVIVPVYNVERYLDQCLESIVNQSYRHLEILVVDDGSTDSSGMMCDRWAERDERISVIHQPNGGLSAARNSALDVMKGEWVIMVDSDDLLHPEATATLVNAITQYNADIVVGDYIAFNDNELPQWPDNQGKNGTGHTFSQEEALTAIFYQRGLTHSAWARIYRADLFDGIRYPVGQLYEDLAIIYPLLKKCDKVVKIEPIVYGYRQRESSILGNFSPRRADVLEICEGLENLTLNQDHRYLKSVRSRLLSAYFNILLLSHHDKNGNHKALQDRCWAGIKRLRLSCLFDSNVRMKNKLGILASLLGRNVLCSVIGRNYKPQP